MITFGRHLPVTIHPGFWLMAVLIGFLNSGADPVRTVIWVMVILISVLIHELGHALTSRLLGYQTAIDLVVMGGLTRSETGGRPLPFLKEFFIVLNGPLAGLGLFAFCYSLLNVVHTGVFRYALVVAVNVNFFWTLLNLLPIQPLDGGKLTSVVLKAIFGLRGVKIALFLSVVLAALLGLLSFMVHQIWVGSILLLFAFESYREWKDTLSLVERDTDQDLQSRLKQGEDMLQQMRFLDAEMLLQDVRSKAGSGKIFLRATEQLAKVFAAQERFQESYDLLVKLRHKLSGDALVLKQQVAYRLGLWRDAADVGQRLFAIAPSVAIALKNARCHARLREVKPTIGWLRAALREGLQDLPKELENGDYDAVRSSLQSL